MKEWPCYTWGDLIELKYGKRITEQNSGGSVPVFGSSGQIGTTREVPLCNHPSFVLGRKGVLGVRYSKIPFSVIDTAFYVEAKVSDIDLKWAYYKFLTYDLKSLDSGSAVPSTRKQDVYAIPVSLPPLLDQQAIVNVLSILDDKIELNEQINENLLAQAISRYRVLTEHDLSDWTTIGDLASNIYSGGTPSTKNASYWDGSYPWLSSGETSSRFIASTLKTITKSGIDNSSTRLAHAYDVVIASAGQGHTRGQVSMLLTDSYVNQSVIVIHAVRDILPFIFISLATSYDRLRGISDSSSIRGSLTTKMISSFAVPAIDVQNRTDFAEFTWPLIHAIERNLRESIHLQQLRDTLLPRLMSGELDVSEVEV